MEISRRGILSRASRTYHSNSPHDNQSSQNSEGISDAGLVEDAPVQSEEGELDGHDDSGVCQLTNEQADG